MPATKRSKGRWDKETLIWQSIHEEGSLIFRKEVGKRDI